MAPEDARAKVLTIDGPAGVGKSSVARRVAARLCFFHLDTGAMYRAVTLAALRAGLVGPDAIDAARLAPVLAHWVTARRMRVGEGGKVWLGDEDVSDEVRSAAVTALVSPVSAVPSVRAALVEWQRSLAAEQLALRAGVVVEGRDAGSYIFPTARWRFYLDASLLERARRRLRQHSAAQVVSHDASHELTVAMERLAQRDRIDRERPLAPLCVPDGATVLDTTHRDLDQVVAAICAEVAAESGGAAPPGAAP
ncbi:MAG: (d)CMP kinase [Planctomycetes bacterium]|nr:(d)CMP kinase [Planctomycetota bacterium]